MQPVTPMLTVRLVVVLYHVHREHVAPEPVLHNQGIRMALHQRQSICQQVQRSLCYVDLELGEWRKRINQSHVLGAKVY